MTKLFIIFLQLVINGFILSTIIDKIILKCTESLRCQYLLKTEKKSGKEDINLTFLMSRSNFLIGIN